MCPETEVRCMCGNRVEELESQITELQASVEGLTDELVECKVRLAELEEVVDEEMGYVPELRDDGDGDATDEEMRVPEPGEPQDAAEAPNTEAPDEADNTEESESDSDIIVA
jgi:predicted nuclease with TOPRIM domain